MLPPNLGGHLKGLDNLIVTPQAHWQQGPTTLQQFGCAVLAGEVPVMSVSERDEWVVGAITIPFVSAELTMDRDNPLTPKAARYLGLGPQRHTLKG